MVPTPTPGNKRRRELMRQSRSQLATADLVSTPASSRSSTPARSRHSTPQNRHRARRTPVPFLSPVHATHLQAIDSFIPNSPPPPYEINLDSPFHVIRLVEEGPPAPVHESTTDEGIQQINDIQIPSGESGCGCPGACGCGPPSLNASVDSSAPLLEPRSYEPEETDFELESSTIDNDHNQQGNQKSVNPCLSVGECNEAINHRLARSFLSVDRVLHPTLGQLKNYTWNKSL